MNTKELKNRIKDLETINALHEKIADLTHSLKCERAQNSAKELRIQDLLCKYAQANIRTTEAKKELTEALKG